jgi:hypothetical protein
MWAVFPTFRRYILPSTSGSKYAGWLSFGVYSFLFGKEQGAGALFGSIETVNRDCIARKETALLRATGCTKNRRPFIEKLSRPTVPIWPDGAAAPTFPYVSFETVI